MTPAVAGLLNALGLLAVTGVLGFAFFDQLRYDDLPCPLCLLQRVGFVLAGFGLALNLRFGVRPSHYAVTIIGASTGAAVSVRQILLHIVPGSGSYGDAFLGLHFYTWALIVFSLIILGTAGMLLFDRQFRDDPREHLPLRGVALIAFAAFALVTAANAGSTFLECGVGLCADNPTFYEMLKR